MDGAVGLQPDVLRIHNSLIKKDRFLRNKDDTLRGIKFVASLEDYLICQDVERLDLVEQGSLRIDVYGVAGHI